MRERSSESPGNLLEAMLESANVPNSGITDDIIAANVMTLLLAGEDTTAHYSWLIARSIEKFRASIDKTSRISKPARWRPGQTRGLAPNCA
jgi:hypothetical protein